MATFTGQQVKDTYKSILKLEDNQALTTSLKKVQDAQGNDTPMSISTTDVSFSSNIEAAGYTIPGGTGNQYLRADGTVGIISTADLDYIDYSEGVVNNKTVDSKSATNKAVYEFVQGVTSVDNSGDAVVDIDFTTPNWHASVTGAWTFGLTNISAHIGQAGNIVITNAAATTPGALPVEFKTPNGDSIIWDTTSGTTSIISYYIVDINTILINYIGNFS
jgi:hypothetical protein